MPKRTSVYIGIVVLAALICAALFMALHSSFGSSQDVISQDSSNGIFPASTSTPVSITSDSQQSPPNTKTYQTEAYHFSLLYPKDLTVRERPGGDNSMVILFQDQANQEGFEIFITPYNDQKITQQRFEMDEPSGVMQDPQNITIDGAPATEFLSTNPAMGASREIWFLHGGFLYEVTAPQSLDNWLLQIMETWQFVGA